MGLSKGLAWGARNPWWATMCVFLQLQTFQTFLTLHWMIGEVSFTLENTYLMLYHEKEASDLLLVLGSGSNSF